LLGLALDHGMKLVGRRHAARLRAAAQVTHSGMQPAGAGQQATQGDGPAGRAGSSMQGLRHPGDQPPESGSRTVRFEPHLPVAVPSRNRSTAALED
jgi:membrane-associated protein